MSADMYLAQGRAGSYRRNLRQRDLCELTCRVWPKEEMMSTEQRGIRMVEEAIEYAQAVKVDPAMLHALIDYVYAKEAGDPLIELGQVGVTVLVSAHAHNQSADLLERVAVESLMAMLLQKPEYMRQRNERKNQLGFLAAHLRIPGVQNEDSSKGQLPPE